MTYIYTTQTAPLAGILTTTTTTTTTITTTTIHNCLGYFNMFPNVERTRVVVKTAADLHSDIHSEHSGTNRSKSKDARSRRMKGLKTLLHLRKNPLRLALVPKQEHRMLYLYAASTAPDGGVYGPNMICIPRSEYSFKKICDMICDEWPTREVHHITAILRNKTWQQITADSDLDRLEDGEVIVVFWYDSTLPVPDPITTDAA